LPLELEHDLYSLRWWFQSSLNCSIWTKNKMRKLCTDEVGRVKMKKNAFCNWKNVFSLLLLFDCSVAFQRLFLKLEKVLLQRFKSLKMQKNWERTAEVFGDKLVFDDGPVYFTYMPNTSFLFFSFLSTKIGLALGTGDFFFNFLMLCHCIKSQKGSGIQWHHVFTTRVNSKKHYL
jgi:hypothetical protein